MQGRGARNVMEKLKKSGLVREEKISLFVEKCTLESHSDENKEWTGLHIDMQYIAANI